MAEGTLTTGGIGKPVLRKEDMRLITGQGRYTDDVSVPGQAYVAIVRSPHAHATIRAIDKTAALAASGTLAVLTAEDIAADGLDSIPCYAANSGINDIPLVNSDGSPNRTTPIPLLATGKARFAGDGVAAVVAETQAAALAAAELVEVDYDPLPAVTATADSIRPDAPKVWDGKDNFCVDGGFGDKAATEAAFAAADHVVELNTEVQRVTGVPLEPRAAVCEYDATTGHYTLYCGGDNSVRVKRDLAAVLRIDEGNVRVVARDIGGNFGTRNWFYPEYGIVAWAARKLGRPVRFTAVRSEALLSDYQGRDLLVEAALALDKTGRFLGLRATLTSNVGAYTVSFVPLNKTAELLTSVYDIPAAFVRPRAVLSNTSPTAPYRSAGRPEAMYIMERLVEKAARTLGFDPIALRRKNLIAESRMPYKQALGLTYDSGRFEEAMDRALRLADWQGFPARKAAAEKRGKLAGIGLANYIEVTSGFPMERTEIVVKPEGQVDVVIGTTPSGQGHETSFAQCVSDWLGVPFEAIRVITGDTAIVKDGGGSHSARSMRLGGIVMGHASNKIVEKGRQIAAHALEAAPGDVEFAQGVFRIKGTDRTMGMFDVARAASERADLPAELKGPLAAEHQEVTRVPGYPYGAQVIEIEIDPDTGQLTIVRQSAVDDVGRAINPIILHGQTHGGIAQGVGQALLEHSYYDRETGQNLAGSFMDYAMPRADIFPFFATEIMEVPTPTNALGVRGGGEGGTTPALAVVTNAIVDALQPYGVTHFEMPATAERIWRAIHGKP